MSGFAGMMFGNFAAPAVAAPGAVGGQSSMDADPKAAYQTLTGNWGGSNPTGTGDFTWEGWVYNTNAHDNQIIFETRNDSGGAGWAIRTVTVGANNGIMYLYNNGGATITGEMTSGLTINTWHHVAVCRTSGTTKVYYDGTAVITVTDGGNYTANFWRVGGYWGTYNSYDIWTFEGYLDEFRYSSTARYSGSTITVPTSPFTSDGSTLLLLHMDGTNGGTTFTDSSSHNRTVTRDAGNPTTTTAYYQF